MNFSAILAPYLHQFSIFFFCDLGHICIKFWCSFSIKILNIYIETAGPSSGAILEQFSEQYYHQSIKKHHIHTLYTHWHLFFNESKFQIQYTF